MLGSSVHVMPYVFYHATGQLETADAKLLAEWTESGGIQAILKLFAYKAGEEALKAAVEKLFESAALAAGVEVAGMAHEISELYTEEGEQLGFLSLVLNALGVRAQGLGITADSGGVSLAPGQAFVGAFAGDGAPPLNLFGKGLLWRYGQSLASALGGTTLGPQQLDLQIFEVSYCSQAGPCGPGYLSGSHRLAGIHPFFYFDFHSQTSNTSNTFTEGLVVSYNAHTWMSVQPKLKS